MTSRHAGQSTKRFTKPPLPWGEVFPSVESEPYRPHAYQKKAIKWLLEHEHSALFMDPGLGKTSTTLAALKVLKAKHMFKKALVLAPLRVCHSVWPGERERWEDFHGLKMVVLHGDKKGELLQEKADVYVLNYDGLAWLLDIEVYSTPTGKRRPRPIDMMRWKALGFDLLIMDELSKLKHPNSVRFRALKQVVGSFGRRWGLTGSPAPNGLEDLFGQVYMLDLGKSFGQYVTHYRTTYFSQSFDGYNWILNEGADKSIYKKLKPLALRMSAADHLDMPQLVENDVKVTLPKAARKIYDELEDDLFTKIEDKVVIAANAAAASMKCRQAANGAVYVEDLEDVLTAKKGKDWAELHSAKLDAVEDLRDELQGSPLLVAYDFEHDLVRLKERLGDVPHIGGGVTTKKAKAIEAAWNAGEIPVMLGHPQSLAHGLNLQGAGFHVAWFALTWNYELYDQFIRRVWRQGQKAKRVFVHHFIATATVDVDVMRALRSKRKGQNALFDALKERVIARRGKV